MDNRNQIQTAIDAAQKPFIQIENGLPIAFVPNGNGDWTMKELEHLRTEPARKKGTTHLHQLDSFIAYTNRHKEAGSQIIVDANYATGTVKFKTILNGDHDVAGFGDNIARYEPQKTVDWQNWLGMNGKKVEQLVLATFLTDNIANIAETNPANPALKYPSAAEMLEFVTNLEMTSTVKYRSGTKVQNGQVQFEYVEEGSDQTKGKLAMFERFGIGLTPFAGGTPYFIEAFLRFRINRDSGVLTIWFDLHRPDKVLEAATVEMIATLQQQIEAAPIYFGAA